MRFKVIYKVGTNLREKRINAQSLDEAEKICNKKIPKWVDIKILTKEK